jgi:hypothetical protein
MYSFVLIDLCCPADLGAPHEIAEAAATAGLQSVIYVVDDAAELPDIETIEAIASDPKLATLYPGVATRGPGFGYVILIENWSDSPLLAALDGMNDPNVIERAAHDAGGCAIPVSPRQGPDGEVFRSVTAPSDVSRIGTVAYVAGGTYLGRDLDVEDTAAARRRVLAGTGPYGARDDLGRFATLFQVMPGDLTGLINALKSGLGLSLELGGTHSAPPPEKTKRRRRRKRSGRRRNQNNDGEQEETSDSGSSEGTPEEGDDS